MDTSRIVLDFARTLIWPGLLLITILLLRQPIAALIDRATSVRIKGPGFEGQVEAVTRALERNIATTARALTSPQSHQGKADVGQGAEDRRAGAPASGHEDGDQGLDETARRKAIEELLAEGAAWGWQMAQLGWDRLPSPDISWDRNGLPTLTPQTRLA